jgi:hypothetical protein
MTFTRPEPAPDSTERLTDERETEIRALLAWQTDGLGWSAARYRAVARDLIAELAAGRADLAAANDTIAALRTERDEALKQLALQRYFDPSQYREGI